MISPFPSLLGSTHPPLNLNPEAHPTFNSTLHALFKECEQLIVISIQVSVNYCSTSRGCPHLIGQKAWCRWAYGPIADARIGGENHSRKSGLGLMSKIC